MIPTSYIINIIINQYTKYYIKIARDVILMRFDRILLLR